MCCASAADPPLPKISSFPRDLSDAEIIPAACSTLVVCAEKNFRFVSRLSATIADRRSDIFQDRKRGGGEYITRPSCFLRLCAPVPKCVSHRCASCSH